MKKFVTILVVFALVTSVFAQKHKMELNLKQGAVYIQNVDSKFYMTQKTNGKTQTTDMTTSGKIRYKVIGIKDSIYDLEAQYEILSMNTRSNIGNSFYSLSSENKDKKDLFSSALNEITKKPFNLKMSKRGKVVEIQNFDLFFSNVIDDIFLEQPENKQRMMALVNQSFGDKTLIKNFEQNYAILPELPVSIGDKWTATNNYDTGMSAKADVTYELTGSVGNCYVIEGISKIVTKDKEEYKELNGMKAKSDVSGLITSTTKVNKKTGWIKEQVMNSDLTSVFQIKETSQFPEGLTIEMKMNMEMKISDKLNKNIRLIIIIRPLPKCYRTNSMCGKSIGYTFFIFSQTIKSRWSGVTT